MKQFALTLRNAALDLVFPPTCQVCAVDLEEGFTAEEASFCPECIEEFPFFAEPFCSRCGCGMPNEVGACPYCFESKLPQDATVALGDYADGLRDAILRMKHSTGDSLALAMGELMWSRCENRLRDAEADVVVPVPIHWSRRIWRGTNGPEQLAEVLARRLGVPVENGLLCRRRITLPQSGLRPAQRKRNLRNALAVSGSFELHETRVLLVDDVMTTGSTVNAAVRQLRLAGAKHITVAVLARPTRHEPQH